MLLPRTIRLDQSDAVIFAQPAEPGEWSVPGTFLFVDRPLDTLSRKEQIAFRSGFLGIASFGWSTLAVVSEARAEDRAEAVSQLAHQLVDHLGAPSLAAALPAAEEEIALAGELCRGHDVGTLLALHRTMDDTGIREQFRTLKPRADTAFAAEYLGGHDRAFHLVETDEDDDGIDLVSMGDGGDRP
ncbi:MAG: DUF6505 family protein [Phyllobacteriaceae bacterium]|jgi:hypothetical protein|nr:DUF6505 family protein [Phyllobacteriaceae bacterium]